ncbi:hypothetical protein COY26_02420 [Candidatus Woesearchaeota archaeon CG_4_10_14_0_2_um_filter_33_10]|nr:MAG: hypothetical protein AUJ83_00900 [Candidatus Woesearchaeota archaeon CG1_02_33_12]PIU72902.1 MAG: hypothetical protein COS79_00695 [Candidatus Woesearchaeota archaeon CG06_land_8_20_14_3_00_33_13]PIZ53261.1 MAG: hypothetical protein COY26_02420 [Candidatus Woesearchaeota archaeon CG_4_10_14_0_2_um_filter_33_10]
MFDMKISTAIIVDLFLGISGVLFWFSDSFAQALGVIGFFKRLFAGIVCFIILAIVTFIATRN